ncbi:MAG: 23S rRNA (guanosine(2251)-2'-O)-methyltransferase RlmB [Alphaproteobacteria bacterium]|nr:23S rRNA (guanosine(2251)-2'-O)-methyltransferase RlmB [Alphaproteobacteria bacterium]
MSQKERSFQSKPRSGGQKFGGRGGSAPSSRGRDRDRPAGRGFSERSEGDRSDRPARAPGRTSSRPYDRDARPARSFDRPRREDDNRDRPRGKPFEKREFGDRDSRPPRERSYSDKPYQKREYGGGEGRKDFGDKKPYQKREYAGGEGRKDFGDKKPYNKEKRYDRPQKSYERYDDRPAKKDFGADRAPPDSAETYQKLKSSRPSYGAPSSAYLYGIHAVTQALLNPKRIHQRLLCTEKGYESLQETWAEALDDGISLPEVTTVEKEDIERLLPRDAVHQDILLDCQPLEEIALYDLLLTAPDNAKVLVLDQVTDPHNIGAILRSAAAFGAIAVVMQTLHAPEVTGTLAKSASGAVEHVPLVREVNLSRALEQLKKAGFFCIGLDEDGKQTLAQLKLTGKTALVLGAEGSGLRRLVSENCDELVKLPTQGPIGSLNVSNAAAVALYELVRGG